VAIQGDDESDWKRIYFNDEYRQRYQFLLRVNRLLPFKGYYVVSYTDEETSRISPVTGWPMKR
jgi:hypothetical protein